MRREISASSLSPDITIGSGITIEPRTMEAGMEGVDMFWNESKIEIRQKDERKETTRKGKESER